MFQFKKSISSSVIENRLCCLLCFFREFVENKRCFNTLQWQSEIIDWNPKSV